MVDENFLVELRHLLTLAPTDCGWERSSWSRELLAREMAKRTGVRVSRSTAGIFLKILGARWGRARPRMLCPWRKARRPAAPARDPNDALDPETGRGSVLRRRGGHRPQPPHWPRLDPARPTALGPHPGTEREVLSGRSPEPSDGPSDLGRRRPETELALLESAARSAAELSPYPGASPGPRQLHHPSEQDREGRPGRVGRSNPVALSPPLLSRREPHRAALAPAPCKRHPKSSLPNHQPTPNQGPAFSPKCNPLPGESTLLGESGTCIMFQNH